MDPLNQPETAFGDIHRFAGAVRRRALWVGTARLAVTLPLVLAALLGLVALVASAGVARPASLRTMLLLVAGLAGIILAAALVGRTFWRFRRDADVARHLARRLGGLEDAILTALQLERDLPAVAERPRWSSELALAHARATAERLRGVNVAAQLPVAPAGRARRGVVAAALALLALGLVVSRPLGTGLVTLFGEETPVAFAAASVPLVGDLTLREVYPSYTGLAPREVVASSGDVSALRGTVIDLSATAVRESKVAALVFADGPVVPLTIAGRTVTGSFTVDRPVDYRFALEDAAGNLEVEGILRRVSVIDDLYPAVEIISPVGPLTLSERDVLQIDARASDDFGITRVEVVFDLPGGDEPVVRLVEALTEPAPTWEGHAEVPLADLGFSPGDEVRYRIEVTDDDLISGPKRGASAPLTLHIYSARLAHDGVLEASEQAIGQLVRVLGDRLERLFPPAEIVATAPAAEGSELERAQVVLGDVLAATRSAVDTLDRLAAMLREDPLAAKDSARAVANVSARLSEAMRTEVDRVREAAVGAASPPSEKHARAILSVMRKLNGVAVAELEGSIVYLDDLLHRERLKDLVDAGEDVARARDALRDLLEKYAATKDPALKEKIDRAVADLKAKLAALGERMARLGTAMPDEFVNAEALAPVEGEMKSLEEMIASGDIDAALKALEGLSSELDGMLAELGGGATRWTEDHFGGRAAELGRLAEEVEDLAAREKEIERRTAAIDEKRLGRTKEKLRDALDGAARDAKEKLAEIREALVEASDAPVSDESAEEVARSEGRLDTLKGAIASGDLPAARDEALSLADDLEALSGALRRDAAAAPKVDKKGRAAGAVDARAELDKAGSATGKAAATARSLAKDLEEVLPDPREMLTPGERSDLEGLAGRQAELEKKAAALEKSMRAKAGSMPLPSELGPDALGAARGEMKAAESALEEGESRRAKVKAESAADRLARLAEGLKAEAAGAPGPGTGPDRTDGSAGRSGARDKVDIPGGEDHRGPKELREDILKAMKEDSPERYRALIKKYYEELVK